MAIQDLHKVIDGIIAALFEPEDRRLQSWIDRLCVKNQEARGEQIFGFLYGGVYYRHSSTQGAPPAKRAIDPSLFDMADSFLKDKAIIDRDKSFIRQGLFSILDPCNSLQDVRDTLPECLVSTCPQLISLYRERATAFTIVNDPRALRQFNKVLPKMEVYAAARLIY